MDVHVGNKWISITLMAELASTLIVYADDGSIGKLTITTREGVVWVLFENGTEVGAMPPGVYDVTEGRARALQAAARV